MARVNARLEALLEAKPSLLPFYESFKTHRDSWLPYRTEYNIVGEETQKACLLGDPEAYHRLLEVVDQIQSSLDQPEAVAGHTDPAQGSLETMREELLSVKMIEPYLTRVVLPSEPDEAVSWRVVSALEHFDRRTDEMPRDHGAETSDLSQAYRGALTSTIQKPEE